MCRARRTGSTAPGRATRRTNGATGRAEHGTACPTAYASSVILSTYQGAPERSLGKMRFTRGATTARCGTPPTQVVITGNLDPVRDGPR